MHCDFCFILFYFIFFLHLRPSILSRTLLKKNRSYNKNNEISKNNIMKNKKGGILFLAAVCRLKQAGISTICVRTEN